MLISLSITEDNLMDLKEDQWVTFHKVKDQDQVPIIAKAEDWLNKSFLEINPKLFKVK